MNLVRTFTLHITNLQIWDLDNFFCVEFGFSRISLIFGGFACFSRVFLQIDFNLSLELIVLTFGLFGSSSRFKQSNLINFMLNFSVINILHVTRCFNVAASAFDKLF